MKKLIMLLVSILVVALFSGTSLGSSLVLLFEALRFDARLMMTGSRGWRGPGVQFKYFFEKAEIGPGGQFRNLDFFSSFFLFSNSCFVRAVGIFSKSVSTP